MADKENPVIAEIDDANAAQTKIRQRARWLIDRLPDKELKAAEAWLEDIIKSTEVTQAALKELRRLERERPSKKELEKQRQAEFEAQPDLYQQLM